MASPRAARREGMNMRKKKGGQKEGREKINESGQPRERV
jgi:hypothetical protein